MIISKTPLRISFFSGGSDMPAFYTREKGAALSVTIDKFIYVMAHKTQNIGVKIMYDEIEEFTDIEEMQHLITRESLRYYGVEKEITVASVSDILTRGSGLGSSSAFTVGLVNAMANMTGRSNEVSRRYLADVACEIEMNRCFYPVGKQDQFAAAYGGFNLFEFETDGNVTARTVNISRRNLSELNNNLLLVYSGRGRMANAILQKQQKAMDDKNKFNAVRKTRDRAYTAMKYLENGDHESFGDMLHSSWLDKKSVVSEISDDYFDVVYKKATDAGAIGGKLLGAGGGGFFIFYVPLAKREQVSKAVTTDTECKVYDFRFYDNGSRIINSIDL